MKQHTAITGTIAPMLRKRRIAVCVGAGGVGKTTLAAAMAVEAARAGRCVVCLTIDPARRLADSLGVRQDNPTEELTDVTELLGADVKPGGRLSFGMLNTKQAFAEVVRNRASSPEVVNRILNNKLYRYVSGSLSGLQEYMALEKLCAIRDDPEVELIVLDTPPTSNAIDFFTAPRRMIEALDGKLVRVMRRAYNRAGFDFLGRWASVVMRTISRITGVELLGEMIDFVDALSDLFGGFSVRARQVESVLLSSEVAFFLITTPDRATLRETREFRHRLFQLGMNVDGVIFNRAHWPKTSALPDDLDVDRAREISQLNRAWDQAFDQENVLIQRVQQAWEGLRSVAVIPLLPDGATRIDSLNQIGRYF
jgi:anion-transporting  ArsA/GET3 family ATPase